MYELNLLLQHIQKLTPQTGYYTTADQDLMIMRVDRTTQPVAVLQHPTLVFILQGIKRAYLNQNILSYHQGQCLVVATTLTFDCDTIATADEPMFALALKIDMDTMRELASKDTVSHNSATSSVECLRGVHVMNIHTEIYNILLRLVGTLSHPKDREILGQQIKRELFYRILQSTAGSTIQWALNQNHQINKIYVLCEHIHHSYSQEIDFESFIKDSGMSKTLFYKQFKSATQLSPLQYLKQVRLNNAQALIRTSTLQINQIAQNVGYQSTSQFSREYKRLFGVSPNERLS